MNNNKAILLVAIVTLCLAVAGYVFCRDFVPVGRFESAQFLPQAKALPEISLQNQKGNAFVKENFNGHWSLVFFGFVSCPDLCPLTLQTLTQVMRRAEQQQQSIQVVFISLDPERDSLSNIATYLSAFHPSIVGLRGTNPELVLLSHFFAVDYSRRVQLAGSSLTILGGQDIPSAAENHYQVEHSGRIFIVNPQGQYMGSFAAPHTAEILWADLQLILKR